MDSYEIFALLGCYKRLRLVVIDVSGQPISPIVMGQAVQYILFGLLVP